MKKRALLIMLFPSDISYVFLKHILNWLLMLYILWMSNYKDVQYAYGYNDLTLKIRSKDSAWQTTNCLSLLHYLPKAPEFPVHGMENKCFPE